MTLAEVVRAVGESNATVGGHVVQKGNAEYIVRSLGWLGARAGHDDDAFDPNRAVRDLERAVLAATADGSILRVGDVASVTIGPGPRRGVLEKDGNEVDRRRGLDGPRREPAGGHPPAQGEDPRARSRACRRACGSSPFYDRTPLIRGAIGTVTGTIAEAMVDGDGLRAADPAARPRLVRDRADAAPGRARIVRADGAR